MKRRTHKRKHARKHTRKPKAKARAKKAAHPVASKSHQINLDRYMKNKVLVFKLRKKIREEASEDTRQIKTLAHVLKRARRYAA